MVQLKENKCLSMEKMDTKDILIFILTNKNKTYIKTICTKLLTHTKKLTDY